MMSHPLDIGYMGVYTVWANDLGKSSTLLNDYHPSDVSQEVSLR